MKKFILFAALLLAVLPAAALAAARLARAEEALYARVLEEGVYLYSSADETSGLFILPRSYFVRIESEEIRRALDRPLDEVTKAVKDALDVTPPDLASDLMYYGILLTGGGGLLRGLDQRLREETGVPVNVSPTALENVVNGCAKVLEANALSGGFVQSTGQ